MLLKVSVASWTSHPNYNSNNQVNDDNDEDGDGESCILSIQYPKRFPIFGEGLSFQLGHVITELMIIAFLPGFIGRHLLRNLCMFMMD